ncbi:MAG: phosphate ABC transporter permease subunit PstC [Chloroflexi bacterium]|nr:phosphate ABC transporter permease subunit PstC [Chloroflexota bacterium]
MTTATQPPTLSVDDLRGSHARRRRELAIRLVFFAAAGLSVIISGLIVLSLIGEATNFITRVAPDALLDPAFFPQRELFGIPTLVVGTFIVALIGMAVATPLGLGAAVYLSEYAQPRVRKALKPVLEILAGIPSVVLGFFALTVISPQVVNPLCPGVTPLSNYAAAGLAVGILITPLVASVSEDAMYAVPRSLREASYGLGAKKRTTSIRIVVPAAVSGIVAALIIAFSRAIGETLIVAVASGATGGGRFTLDPCGPGQTMTAAMTSLAIGSDRPRGDSLAYPSLFFIGLLLFAMTLVLNIIGEAFVRRVRRAY